MILNRSFASPIVNAGFSYVPPSGDVIPDAITGQAVNNAAVSSLVEFSPVQITGIDSAVVASISGGEMRVSTDGVTYGAYSSVNQSVENNYFIQIRVDASANENETVTATLTAGTVSAQFTANTIIPITIDFIPSLLSTNVQEVTVFKGRGNRFRVQLSHDGEAIDLSMFTRFELYGLTEQPIDSDTSTALDWDDGNGLLNVDVGELVTASGSVGTTLIGYFSEYSEGVVLWHPSLAQSHITVNLINA